MKINIEDNIKQKSPAKSSKGFILNK